MNTFNVKCWHLLTKLKLLHHFLLRVIGEVDGVRGTERERERERERPNSEIGIRTQMDLPNGNLLLFFLLLLLLHLTHFNILAHLRYTFSFNLSHCNSNIQLQFKLQFLTAITHSRVRGRTQLT